MITTNTQILVNRLVKVFSHAIAFWLLCSVASVSYATEADTGVQNPEIAFAKYLEEAKTTKISASCIIVSSASTPSEKKSYCTYTYSGLGNLCDLKEGLNLSEIRLDMVKVTETKKVQKNLTSWFTDQNTQITLKDKEAKKILAFMSSNQPKFSEKETLFDKTPKVIILTKQELDSLPSKEFEEILKKYPNHKHKPFAWQIHKAIEKHSFSNMVSTDNAPQSPGTSITNTALKDHTLTMPANPIPKENADDTLPTKDIQKSSTKKTDDPPKNEGNLGQDSGKLQGNIWLWFVILLSAFILIFLVLFEFLLRKKQPTLRVKQQVSPLQKQQQVLQNNSDTSRHEPYKMRLVQSKWFKFFLGKKTTISTSEQPTSSSQEQQQELQHKLDNSRDESDKTCSDQQILKNAGDDIKGMDRKIDDVQRKFSLILEQLEQLNKGLDSKASLWIQAELEQALAHTEAQLHSEQKQRKNAEKVLKDSKIELDTVKKQLQSEQESRKTAESERNEFKKERDTLKGDKEKFSQLYEAEKKKHQNALVEHKKAETALQAEHQKAETALKADLKENKEKLATLAQQYEQDLQNIFVQRFRIIPPENRDFSEWTRYFLNQKAVWRWAQLTLAGEFMACETQIKQINTQANEIDKQILAVLEVDNWLKQSKTVIGQFFENNDQLWQGLNYQEWLKQLLRADDLLQAYFLDEEQFIVLAKHLSSISGILQAMFAEMGIALIRPKLLERVPDSLPKKNLVGKPKSSLKSIVKQIVNEKHQQMGGLVIVDIEKYGFKTIDNPNPEVRVYVSSPVEWE